MLFHKCSLNMSQGTLNNTMFCVNLQLTRMAYLDFLFNCSQYLQHCIFVQNPSITIQIEIYFLLNTQQILYLHQQKKIKIKKG